MEYWVGIIDQFLIFSVFAVSLNLLLGYSGQISVAHAAFGAIGGYTAACLGIYRGWPALPTLLAAVVVAGVVGVVVGLPALRLRTEYLILLTVALSSIVTAVTIAVPALGGSYGLLATESVDFSPLPTGELLFPSDWLVPLVVAAVVVYALCWRLGESPWGRVLRSIRDDDLAARALGKNVYAYKLTVFGITAGLAGLAGALLFFFNQLASPDVYGFDISLSIFAMVIFGGIGNLTGSLLGAAVLTFLQPVLIEVVDLRPEVSFLVQAVIYGAILILVIRLRPEGVLPEGRGSLLRLFRRPTPARRPTGGGAQPPAGPQVSAPGTPRPGTGDAAPRTAERVEPTAGRTPTVTVRDVTKSFGGIRAVNGLSLELYPGVITALIGPNGAGKTTVFNLLTGALRPDSGSIRLDGQEVVGRSPNAVARLGMVRSFQDVRLFDSLSVLDNVTLAVQNNAARHRRPVSVDGGENLVDLFLRPGRTNQVERASRDAAWHWLEMVGLPDVAATRAADLSYGQQKLVAIARLLATEAQVLLLDEPLSGVDSLWVDRVLDVVSGLREHGKAVCIVEHSVHVVEQLADTVAFMEAGQVTAQGTIAELTSDARLTEAYFGAL